MRGVCVLFVFCVHLLSVECVYVCIILYFVCTWLVDVCGVCILFVFCVHLIRVECVRGVCFVFILRTSD